VIELSLNEVESLAAKVGRGCGFSWGLAEETGRAARRLAQDGFPWAMALLALAEQAGGLRPPSLLQVDRWRKRDADMGSTAPLCPVRTATLLIDDPTMLCAGPLRLNTVGIPLWVAGVLTASSGDVGFAVRWSRISLSLCRQRIVAKALGDAWLMPAADVEILPAPIPRSEPPALRRALIDPAVLTALGSFAARLHVPASESSRTRGAGGGSVDDE
jgi:hypothetical protein